MTEQDKQDHHDDALARYYDRDYEPWPPRNRTLWQRLICAIRLHRPIIWNHVSICPHCRRLTP